jgi:polyisoprenoid-binding protein YceI
MKKLAYLVLGVIILLAVATFAGYWFLWRTDAKPKPKIVENVTVTTKAARNATTGTTATITTPDGTWKITTGVGSTDDEKTFVGYRVHENLTGISQTATGRTPAVSGTLTISGAKVTAESITADLTQLASDQSRRDDAIRDGGLQTNTYPKSTFVLSAPVDVGAVAKDKTETVSATGTFTLHGVTKTVTISLQARWDGPNIQVTGTLPVAFSDYGISAPNRGGFVTVDDHGSMDINLWFTKA